MSDLCKELSDAAGQKALEIINNKTALTVEDISAVKALADICYMYNFNLHLCSHK